MLRSLIPMISAASSQLICPLIALVITSLIFIARSQARAGYNAIHFLPPLWMRHYVPPALRPDISLATNTGHIICYRHAVVCSLDVDSLVVYKRRYVQRCTAKHQADTDVTIALLGSEVGDAGIFLSNVSHP